MRYYIDLSDKRNQRLLELLQQQGKAAAEYTADSFLYSQGGVCYVFSPAKRLTPEDIARLSDGSRLFAGSLSPQATDVVRQKNIVYTNFLSDEVFAHKNAALTAEGILSLLIINTEKSIYQNNILLLGWGRCAKAAALIFSRLGLRFSVASFNESKAGDCALHCNNCYLKDSFIKDLAGFDVIINTIPSKILGEDAVTKIGKNTLVIEVASSPCLDFDRSKQLGFTYLPAPGLPQVFSCSAAAELMLNVIDKY